MLADPNAKAADFRRPGHILPLRARPGGVRVRRGHTEATVDLCRLAGKFPAGVIAELVEEGEAVEEEVEEEEEGQEQQQEGESRSNGEANGHHYHTNGITKKKGASKAKKLKAEIGGNNGMMRRDGCLKFGRKYGLKVCTIEAMVKYLGEKNIEFPIEEKSETELGAERVEVSGHLNGKHT